MKIASSSVAMAATTSFSQKTEKNTNLQFWVGDREPNLTSHSSAGSSVTVDISALARKLSQQARAAAARQQNANSVQDDGTDQTDGLTDKDRQTLQILDAFFYRITGKHIKIYTPDKSTMKSLQFSNPIQLDVSQAQPVPQKAGFGLIYDSSQKITESAKLNYQAVGQVQTQDGRTIDFSVALNMSREYQSDTEVHVRAGDALVDPLVINLNGAPQLSQKNFSFDIDNDGQEEQISKLLTGSGFLALDKNGDGQINNGGELFGPTNGNGFAELKTYDSDGNNWIDENDAVYDKLRIWMADENGDMQLTALGQQGIGAIYLGNTASQFDIKDNQNNTLGTVQSTGVYLKEDGSAGTIQHIDLTV